MGAPDLNLSVWRVGEPLFSLTLPVIYDIEEHNELNERGRGGGGGGGCRIDLVITITAPCYTGMLHFSS